jgi:ATP-dependent protease ClpP protease subunit
MAASEITLYGEVGWDFNAKSVMEQLKAAKDPVTVRIHSPGGSVFDGLAIYTMLRQRGVTVQVDGLAASAASLIAMAGKTIRMGQGAMMMAHRAWTVAMGDGDSMRHAAGILDGIDASITSIYAARLKKPVEDMAKMLAGEVWLTAEQAKADGWADEIFNGPAPRAQLKLSGLANVPAAAMAAWGGAPTKTEAPMGAISRMLALVGVKPAEGETDEQTIGRLDALTAALGEGPEARAAFLANETAPQVFARLRQELVDAQAKIVAGAAALAEAQKLAGEASALKAALTAEQAKVAALAPGLATNAPAAAASNAPTPTATAAEYLAAVDAAKATGLSANDAMAAVAKARPELVTAYNAERKLQIRK